MENKKFIATFAESNFSGVGILAIENGIDDVVIACNEINGKRKRATKSKIRYDAHGTAYFIKNNRRYILSDFLKVEN